MKNKTYRRRWKIICPTINPRLFFSVSKTTKELLLSWDKDKTHEDPVTVAQDLRLPQFEMEKITTNRCHETNHMGKK